MKSLTDALFEERTLPVTVIEDALQAPDLARTLADAGLHTMEITLRTSAALEAIRAVADTDDMHIGAGTVLSVDDCKRAVDAGATFIISPGCNAALLEYCTQNSIPLYPGVCTPTDIDLARSFGFKDLKFFPAEASGGTAFLKAISAPYRQVRFIPTGGINADNFDKYLKLPSVIACGSSWIVEKHLIAQSQWAEITKRIRAMLAVVKETCS